MSNLELKKKELFDLGDKLLERFELLKFDRHDKRFVFNPTFKIDLSKEGLDKLIEEHKDIPKARNIRKNDNRYIFLSNEDYYTENKETLELGQLLIDIRHKLGEMYIENYSGVEKLTVYREKDNIDFANIKPDRITQKGIYWYPKNGYCGWHTNSNTKGRRIYLVWAEEDDKSFFRYLDKDTKEVVTKYEKKGWQINDFNIEDGDNLSWHSVYSNTNRLSLGFTTNRIIIRDEW